MSINRLRKNLGHLKDVAKQYEKARRRVVAVGLPVSKVGQKVYESGAKLVTVGLAHEFGAGVPMRSWLRTPFKVKSGEISEAMTAGFRAVFDKGADIDRQLDRLGIIATNIVKVAFVQRGYGEWPDIKEETKKRKGSSQVLIDQGVLRGSVTWQVRNAS